MAGPGDIGAPPPFPYAFDAPDLASLQFPWSDPPIASPDQLAAVAAQPPPPPELGALQPGIGVPAAALDAAVPPPPQFGPPEAGAVPPPPPPEVAPPAPPPLPYGAEMPPVPAALPPGVAGPAPATVRDQPGLTVRPDPGAEGLRQEQLNDLAQRDPAAFAELQVRDQQDRAAFMAQRRRELADADIEASKQHLADWKAANAATQAKMDAVLADAQRIADTKIDPSGGLSGGQKVAGVLASIIGGLVRGRTGSSHNAGLEALTDTINRGIEAQKADLARQGENINLRRSVLGAEFARHGDMYQAEETIRLATLKHADDILATEQQNYDPRGRTALLIANTRAQIGAAQQAAVQAFGQKNLENELKIQDARRQQQIADQTALHNRQQIGLGYAQLDSAAADRKAARDARADEKQAAADAAKQKTILDRAIGGEPVVVRDAEGNVVSRKLQHITKANGEVWVPNGTEAHITALQKKHAAASQLIATLDEIRRIGPEWLSDTANSDKLQRLKELAGDARLQAIAAKDLGVPTGHDIELADTFLGTNDPTKYRTSLAGIMQSRSSIVRDHNAELVSAGLDKAWEPEDLSKAPSEKRTSAEEAVAEINTNVLGKGMTDMTPGDRQWALASGAFGTDTAPTGRGPTGTASSRAWLTTPEGRRSQETGLPPSKLEAFDALRIDALGPDTPKRAAALAALADIAGTGKAPGALSEAARSYASQLLTDIAASQPIPSSGPSDPPSTPLRSLQGPAAPPPPPPPVDLVREGLIDPSRLPVWGGGE